MNAVLQAKNLSKIYGRGKARCAPSTGAISPLRGAASPPLSADRGSGKTTLLHLLGRLDMPTTGTVLLEGRDIYALSDKQRTILRRRRIGFVFQFYNLVPELTAWQNIVLPLNLDGRRPDAEYLNAVVETLGLTERLGHFAGGLSGGQQQRVAIARALASKPAVILADEPTGNPGRPVGRGGAGAAAYFRRRFGQTLVLVTHDLRIAEGGRSCPHPGGRPGSRRLSRRLNLRLRR